MKFLDLMAEKQKDPAGAKTPTAAFLGDSVTHGCFELRVFEGKRFETVNDSENVYHNDLKKILNLLYPTVPVNMLNAGISGERAEHALKRLDRDVLAYHPDLTVVCFGLNDSHKGDAGLENYRDSLGKIFDALQADGGEVIFMTPNMMNTEILPELREEALLDAAKKAMAVETGGMLARYMDAAREEAGKRGIPVCDVYKKWRMLASHGVRTTDLLSNQINHPVREMHWLFAASLAETLFEG